MYPAHHPFNMESVLSFHAVFESCTSVCIIHIVTVREPHGLVAILVDSLGLQFILIKVSRVARGMRLKILFFSLGGEAPPLSPVCKFAQGEEHTSQGKTRERSCSGWGFQSLPMGQQQPCVSEVGEL